jgi:hypothetical protein
MLNVLPIFYKKQKLFLFVDLKEVLYICDTHVLQNAYKVEAKPAKHTKRQCIRGDAVVYLTIRTVQYTYSAKMLCILYMHLGW